MSPPPSTFDIEIVYGTNKKLSVTEAETIDQVKVGAMGLFGILASEKDQYVLRAKVNGKDQNLPENETVQQAKLHPNEKVTLAAKAPYGCR